MKTQSYDTAKLQDELQELVSDNIAPEYAVQNFDEAGLMTHDDGLIITMEDGSEFQVTIVQTRQGK